MLAAHAREAGQEYIPVHIFPIRYDNKRSIDYLANFNKDNPELTAFSKQLEQAFDYFQNTHQPPLIMVDSKGRYIVGN